MINIKNTWLPQLLSLAQLITEPDTLWGEWVKGNMTTSVVGYDELYCMIFEDMYAVETLKIHGNEIDPSVAKYMKQFLDAFLAFDQNNMPPSQPLNDAEVLKSPEWKKVEQAALALCKAGE